MGRIQWTRAAQFNWVFDNMGGTPLQEAVAGNWHQAMATVDESGCVAITAPNPGGGQVHLVRGVWPADTTFPWEGFWAEPMGGDRTNYYPGGFFVNEADITTITLGTALPSGTVVQLYYIYNTRAQAARYEPLNNYPCIRRACRARDDYTYDFAVDRMLDLMVLLHLAGRERGQDYGPLIRFLWDAFVKREESRTSPLMHDDFERRQWDRGAHLLYRGATAGAAFQAFQNELAEGMRGRALHVKATLPSTQDAAWFGYGLDWSLVADPFKSMDRLTLTLKGAGGVSHLHNLTKIGSGSATLLLLGDYLKPEKRRFLVQMETTGEVGAATFRWSTDGGLTWEDTGLTSGDRQHPITLEDDLAVAWEAGDGTDLVAGDFWMFWGGEPAFHPRRLLVTLNDSSQDDADPWGPEHTYVHAIPDRFAAATAFDLPFAQFWRRDNLIDDGDRVRAMWGGWYSGSQSGDGDITVGTREETEILLGETFYTQRHITWDLPPDATAFGVWAGINPAVCNSAGHANINFLIKPVVSGVGSLSLRTKVKDAQGSYFYRDETVQVNAWQRLTVTLGEMTLESGAHPLTHPLQVVDIGCPNPPPSNGAFYLTDLKFDEHQTFAGADHLRVLEFKVEQQSLTAHEWWLDEVALNLAAADPYPYAPRLAISLTPYGQNPWRGPTLVHYAQPLAPYLVGAMDLSQTYLNLHREAQEEYTRRYGGTPGPIIPVHTRNDVENIALCGEEDFLRFSWWRRHRDFGRVTGFWHFNGALTDASGANHGLTWQGGGAPSYGGGICQPGDTAVHLDGSHYLSLADHVDFNPGTEPFSIEAIINPANLNLTAGICCKEHPTWTGWFFILENGKVASSVRGPGGVRSAYATDQPLIPGQNYHVVMTWNPEDDMRLYVNGIATTNSYYGAVAAINVNTNTDLEIGREPNNPLYFQGHIDLVRFHRGRALSAQEIADNWQIIQGQLNGSAYPEVGSGLGQYWAFLRLAEYYFVSGDAGAEAILLNWLAWLDGVGAPDGNGWKFPVHFSEFGFTYGAYDPGQTAAIALGCLLMYLKNGRDLAATWTRRLLDDLRENRLDPVFGGYKSDYHYAWINSLALRAFGLAAQGAAGQRFVFPSLAADREHFDALMAWVFGNAGDAKPNVLNADLIPFAYSEAADIWEYAPNYMAMRQMGTLEAVTTMLGAALEYGKATGEWTWWQRLLDFILVDHLVRLFPSQLRSLTLTYEQSGPKNLVRVLYADYDQDNDKYAEAREAAAISAWGEQALDLDCRYGGAVVLEDPEVAQLLASRLLARLAAPRELAEMETWLEGARLELGDTVALSSDFHGLDQEEFTVRGKDLDLGGRSVRLTLDRPLNNSWSWAVDAPGSPQDGWAIDIASQYDGNWAFRAEAG